MLHISRTVKRMGLVLAGAILSCGLAAGPAEAHHGGFGRSFGRGLGFGMGSGIGYGLINNGFGGMMGGGFPFGGGFGGGYYGGGYYGGGYAVPSYGPPPAPPQSTNVVIVQQPAAPAAPSGYPYPVPGYVRPQPGQGYVSQTTTYVPGYGYVPQPVTP